MRSGFSSRPSASASLAATVSPRPARLAGPIVSSARVEALSRCCPPGPLERLALQGGFTLHVESAGADDHHIAEAAFKALGRALGDACALDGGGVRSTKGAA